MSAILFANGKQYYALPTGVPNVGGKLYTYAAGTSTPQVTWTDAAQTVPNTNPVVLDARGEALIFWNGNYKVVLKDLNDNTIWTVDNVSAFPPDNSLRSELALPGGADLIGTASGDTVQDSIDTLNDIGFSIDTAPFNAVGDGVADDAVALVAFVNHAIANPGVPHYLGNKVYATTVVMPTISTPNVHIEGTGVTVHNVGSIMTGTQIKWIGALSPAAAMVTLTSVSGGGNQKLSNVIFKGIGLDCNSGTIGYGMKADSIWGCDIDIAVTNPSQISMDMNVVATLGEAADCNKNRVRLQSRSIEAPGGAALRCGGTATANVSMNEFDVDIVHMNNTAIFLNNSDNNDWRFVRTFCVGSATENIALAGSNNINENCRAERFWFVSANLPMHVYGSPSTYPSVDSSLFVLDTANATPAPVIDTGARLNWRKDVTLMDENDWVSYTPTITAAAGTLTTVANQAGEYRKMGKRVEFKFQWTITTNGTGATALQASLPVLAGTGLAQSSTGRERAVGGKQLAGFIDAGSGTLAVFNYDGTYPGVNSGAYVISGFYECA